MRQSLQISTCMVMTIALAACGGGGGGGESSSAPATGERTFPSQVNIRGTSYTALMSSGMGAWARGSRCGAQSRGQCHACVLPQKG